MDVNDISFKKMVLKILYWINSLENDRLYNKIKVWYILHIATLWHIEYDTWLIVLSQINMSVSISLDIKLMTLCPFPINLLLRLLTYRSLLHFTFPHSLLGYLVLFTDVHQLLFLFFLVKEIIFFQISTTYLSYYCYQVIDIWLFYFWICGRNMNYQ